MVNQLSPHTQVYMYNIAAVFWLLCEWSCEHWKYYPRQSWDYLRQAAYLINNAYVHVYMQLWPTYIVALVLALVLALA